MSIRPVVKHLENHGDSIQGSQALEGSLTDKKIHEFIKKYKALANYLELLDEASESVEKDVENISLLKGLTPSPKPKTPQDEDSDEESAGSPSDLSSAKIALSKDAGRYNEIATAFNTWIKGNIVDFRKIPKEAIEAGLIKDSIPSGVDLESWEEATKILNVLSKEISRAFKQKEERLSPRPTISRQISNRQLRKLSPSPRLSHSASTTAMELLAETAERAFLQVNPRKSLSAPTSPISLEGFASLKVEEAKAPEDDGAWNF